MTHTDRASIWRPGVWPLLLLLLVSTPLVVYGSSVHVPIELDYPLLRLLLVKQLFDTPQQTAEVLNDPSGCSRVVLANPRLDARPPNLEIVTEVTARVGVGRPGGCIDLLQWQGSAGFLGRPVIQPGATALRIESVDSWLSGADGGKVTSGPVWDVAKDRFQPLFGRFSLDLAPSIDALRMILPEVLPHRSAQQLQTMVESLRLSDLQVSRESLKVSVSFQVAETAEPPRPEAPLTDEELQQWETRWHMMDALLTFAVKHYASATHLEELRSTLLDVLLDSRYRLRDALTEPSGPTNDPVRRWFLDSWRQLSPVIRRIGVEETGQEPLAWISLLTATDALYALDQLGPAIGLDISADGLRRLARLINDKATVDPLRYDEAVDPELQQLFERDAEPEPEQPSGLRFDLWPIRSAWAGTATDRLDRWVPSNHELGEYLPLVANLLDQTADKALKKHRLEPAVAKLFRKLVLATAWQESCWRQYVVRSKKVVPLRSGTGDVGLMQMNETVWRGFYDIRKLRWDIAYNGRAGAEVLLRYLVRHALKNREHTRAGGLDNLARATYSAYNGGPSQVSRYRNPGAAPAQKKVDLAFWKKYRQVKAGSERNVARCLGGESTTTADSEPPAAAIKKSESGKKKSAAPRDSGERWLLAQDKDHFTLQLGVFSKREYARTYIAQNALAGQATIVPIRKSGATQFAVLFGGYAKRATADRAKQRLKHLKPWVRTFAEVRKAGKR